MRLLNVDDLCVYEFNDSNRPPYAILSHTWEHEEVSFQSIHTPEVASMAGYAKILKCCEIAKQDGFEYVWIDTCCIDKTSSSELSEAINSMFMWYGSACVCYVFLADESESSDARSFHLFPSRWFTRGWTLQELLAPETVVFYNCEWVNIGTKHSLRDYISANTRIPREVLLDSRLIQTCNVAERMSWAARRHTTRVEDRAYSLMGLFGVNMPLLYGEGDMAFRRLQLEIMKDSCDESIFLGTVIHLGNPLEKIQESDRVDMLAPSLSSFRDIHRNAVELDANYRLGRPFSMSNKGLHIWLRCKQISDVLHLAALNCTHQMLRHQRLCIAIYLHPNTGDCARVSRDAFAVDIADWNTVAAPKELYIKQIYDTVRKLGPSRALPVDSMPVDTIFYFTENISPETGYHLEYLSGGLAGAWTENNPDNNYFELRSSRYGDPTTLGILYFAVKSIQKPNIHALIVIGRMPKVGSLPAYHYRVFRGSKIPPVLECIAKSDSPQEWKSLFAEIFPGDGSLIHYNDRTAERLNDNHIIRITIRRGPRKFVFRHYEEHDFHVHITFGRTPTTGEEISEGEKFARRWYNF